MGEFPAHGVAFFRGDWHVRQRWGVLVLAVVAAGLFGASYLLPWWNFKLVAPQYPQGLSLVISLTGVTGDTAEINTINHYIGMGHLDDAATLERAYGAWAVGALALVVVVLALFAGRRLSRAMSFAALAFPLGFIADTMYWLYHFGHDLDPKAPIHLAVFTPSLFGSGKVGQFVTTATPSWGFGLAALAVVLVVIASWQRRKVCAECPARAHCEALCEHGLVGTPR